MKRGPSDRKGREKEERKRVWEGSSFLHGYSKNLQGVLDS